MKINALNQTVKVILSVLAISFVSFSCAKKPAGIRTVRQTDSKVVNQAVSNASTQAASVQNLLYQMTVVELPGEATDGSFTVNSEIKTPSGQYVPITTTHTNGKDAQGVVEDAANGAKLDIRSRCVGENCDQYIMLVTVVKNNYAVHQMMVISYLNQSYFNIETINASIAPSQMYRSLDEVVQRNGDRYK